LPKFYPQPATLLVSVRCPGKKDRQTGAPRWCPALCAAPGRRTDRQAHRDGARLYALPREEGQTDRDEFRAEFRGWEVQYTVVDRLQDGQQSTVDYAHSIGPVNEMLTSLVRIDRWGRHDRRMRLPAVGKARLFVPQHSMWEWVLGCPWVCMTGAYG
jgi:hypothetical protein